MVNFNTNLLHSLIISNNLIIRRFLRYYLQCIPYCNPLKHRKNRTYVCSKSGRDKENKSTHCVKFMFTLQNKTRVSTLDCRIYRKKYRIIYKKKYRIIYRKKYRIIYRKKYRIIYRNKYMIIYRKKYRIIYRKKYRIIYRKKYRII